MKRIRINESFKRKVRSAARNNGGRVIVQSVKSPHKPGEDIAKQVAKRFLGSSLFNRAVSAFDRLIMERWYTYEELLEIIERWRSHGKTDPEIWLQMILLHQRKKQMKPHHRPDIDPIVELSKYYDKKTVHCSIYEFMRCKETWRKRAALRRKKLKERMKRERLARLSTGALPDATSIMRSRPSTTA